MSSSEWSKRQAPSLAEFEAIADAAFARLPRRFRDLCKDVVIRVDDFPTDEVLELDEHRILPSICSVFTTASISPGRASWTRPRCQRSCFYRRPILDYWAEHEDTLGQIVTHVLVHEIGHHFGLSDADMHRIEEEAAA